MAILSRTAEKCRKCPNVKKCNNKRLEAYALAELPKQSRINATAPVTIPMGEYGDMHTTIEEINEKIAKALSVNSCYLK